MLATDAYDAWGNLLASKTPQGVDYDLTDDPYGYKAQFGYYTDRETGLILCTYRYYDPAMGRWLSRDPIGYEGGINLYRYCGNDPVNRVDRDGLHDIGIAHEHHIPGQPDVFRVLVPHYSNGVFFIEAGGQQGPPDCSFAFGAAGTIYGIIVPPEVRKQIEDAKFVIETTYMVLSIPGLLKKAGTALAVRLLGNRCVNYSIGSHVSGQMTKRGWSASDIQDVLNKPHRKVRGTDHRNKPDGSGKMDDPATIYFRKDGHYVIRNDRTGDIVQISDRNKPGWLPPTH